PCAPHAPLAPPAGNLRCPPELRSTHHGAGVVFDDLVTQSGSARLLEFRIRRDHSSDALVFADSPAVRIPRVWDILSLRGRPVIILGVPQTHPVSRVNGVMVSCFLTPDTERSQYTYPSEVKEEIEGLVGRYMVDVEGFRTEEKGRLLAQIEEMTEKRFQVAEHLLETRPWDLFFMVEMGTDR